MKFYGVYVPSLLGEATIGFHLKAHLKSSSSSTYRKKERKKKQKKTGSATHSQGTSHTTQTPRVPQQSQSWWLLTEEQLVIYTETGCRLKVRLVKSRQKELSDNTYQQTSSLTDPFS